MHLLPEPGMCYAVFRNLLCRGLVCAMPCRYVLCRGFWYGLCRGSVDNSYRAVDSYSICQEYGVVLPLVLGSGNPGTRLLIVGGLPPSPPICVPTVLSTSALNQKIP